MTLRAFGSTWPRLSQMRRFVDEAASCRRRLVVGRHTLEEANFHRMECRCWLWNNYFSFDKFTVSVLTNYTQIWKELPNGSKSYWSVNLQTAPPLCVWLARLREEKGITQQQAAAKLGVRQASVSGFERREDIQVSTLRRFVEALGGYLLPFAMFPEGKFTLEDKQTHIRFAGHDENERCANVPCTKEMTSILRASVAWSLHVAGSLEQAVERAGRIKRNHALLEIP